MIEEDNLQNADYSRIIKLMFAYGITSFLSILYFYIMVPHNYDIAMLLYAPMVIGLSLSFCLAISILMYLISRNYTRLGILFCVSILSCLIMNFITYPHSKRFAVANSSEITKLNTYLHNNYPSEIKTIKYQKRPKRFFDAFREKEWKALVTLKNQTNYDTVHLITSSKKPYRIYEGRLHKK